jgi:hypothetical protein
MNDTKILQIIKNNIVFIVVFCVLLLLYIIFLCYQIYVDSKKVKRPYVTQCPDYWNIGEEEYECTYKYPKHLEGASGDFGAKRCTGTGKQDPTCVSFKDMDHVHKCKWSKSNNISWDTLHSAGFC